MQAKPAMFRADGLCVEQHFATSLDGTKGGIVVPRARCIILFCWQYSLYPQNKYATKHSVLLQCHTSLSVRKTWCSTATTPLCLMLTEGACGHECTCICVQRETKATANPRISWHTSTSFVPSLSRRFEISLLPGYYAGVGAGWLEHGGVKVTGYAVGIK